MDVNTENQPRSSLKSFSLAFETSILAYIQPHTQAVSVSCKWSLQDGTWARKARV